MTGNYQPAVLRADEPCTEPACHYWKKLIFSSSVQVHFEHSGQGADCSIHVKDLKAPCLAQVHTVPLLVNRNTQDIAQGLNFSWVFWVFFFYQKLSKPR